MHWKKRNNQRNRNTYTNNTTTTILWNNSHLISRLRRIPSHFISFISSHLISESHPRTNQTRASESAIECECCIYMFVVHPSIKAAVEVGATSSNSRIRIKNSKFESSKKAPTINAREKRIETQKREAPTIVFKNKLCLWVWLTHRQSDSNPTLSSQTRKHRGQNKNNNNNNNFTNEASCIK